MHINQIYRKFGYSTGEIVSVIHGSSRHSANDCFQQLLVDKTVEFRTLALNDVCLNSLAVRQGFRTFRTAGTGALASSPAVQLRISTAIPARLLPWRAVQALRPRSLPSWGHEATITDRAPRPATGPALPRQQRNPRLRAKASHSGPQWLRSLDLMCARDSGTVGVWLKQ